MEVQSFIRQFAASGVAHLLKREDHLTTSGHFVQWCVQMPRLVRSCDQIFNFIRTYLDESSIIIYWKSEQGKNEKKETDSLLHTDIILNSSPDLVI